MNEAERAAFAAHLATLSGEDLQTLLVKSSPVDDYERFVMIEAEADKVWDEYLAETTLCAVCDTMHGPFREVAVECPSCGVTHHDLCCAECAAELEQ